MSKSTCTAPGCERESAYWELCTMHVQRVRKYGTTEIPQRQPKRCKVEGCDRKYRCSGYCGIHYARVRATSEAGPVGRMQRAPQECEADGCSEKAKFFGLCASHEYQRKRIAEVESGEYARIYSWATNEERLRAQGWTEKVVRPGLGPCWEWNGLRDKRGYGRVAVEGRKMRFAHRIAYMTWVSDLADSDYMCHKCDNPSCINPAHLFPGDQTANMSDAAKKDRTAFGVRQGQAKLNDDLVREIRARYVPRKVSQAYLAAEYGVSQAAINKVVRGKTWRRVA